MLRAIIISDTHAGTIEKLSPKLIEEIKRADIVIHAGDADTHDFIKELKKISKILYAVRGNCDWGSDLPLKIVFSIDRLKIGVSHGAGNYSNVIDRMAYLFSDDDADIIIFGHTHVPVNEDAEGIRYINPGSTSLNRSLRYGTYGLLTVEGEKFESKILRIGDE